MSCPFSVLPAQAALCGLRLQGLESASQGVSFTTCPGGSGAQRGKRCPVSGNHWAHDANPGSHPRAPESMLSAESSFWISWSRFQPRAAHGGQLRDPCCRLPGPWQLTQHDGLENRTPSTGSCRGLSAVVCSGHLRVSGSQCVNALAIKRALEGGHQVSV